MFCEHFIRLDTLHVHFLQVLSVDEAQFLSLWSSEKSCLLLAITTFVMFSIKSLTVLPFTVMLMIHLSLTFPVV